MATLQQLEEGIRRAHAAGNAEHVKALGAEYRRLQAQGGGSPQMDAAGFAQHLATGEQSSNIERAAPVNPQASQLPGIIGQFDETSRAAQSGFNQGLTFGFGDELYAGATAPLRAIPGLFNGEGYDMVKAYSEGIDTTRQTMRDTSALNPVASGVGEVTGAIVNPASRVLAPVKGAAPVVNVMRGVGGGAATGAVYGFGSSDGDMGDRARGALVGGGIGAGMGLVAPWLAKKGGDAVEGFLQNRATSQAIKNAPAAEDLSAAASQLFKESRAAGVGVKPQVFGTFARDTAAKARAMDIDPELDQAAWTVYERLIERAKQGFSDPSSLTLSRLHNLRQMAQDVVIEAKKPRTKGFAQQIVDGLDDMIGKLKPADLSLPPNRIGGTDANNAGNALLDGISTWAKARRVSLIEQAIAKAQNYSSGFESGLVNQFRSLLNNKSTSKLFTEAERRAMQAVVRGTAPVKILRTLGIFKGLGGALVGSSMGPWGAAAGWVAGNVGKKITEKATESAAQRAARVVATPNIPQVNLRNPLLQLPPGALSLPVIDQTRAIQAR
jgi:hypothetical protein